MCHNSDGIEMMIEDVFDHYVNNRIEQAEKSLKLLFLAVLDKDLRMHQNKLHVKDKSH